MVFIDTGVELIDFVLVMIGCDVLLFFEQGFPSFLLLMLVGVFAFGVHLIVAFFSASNALRSSGPKS